VGRLLWPRSRMPADIDDVGFVSCAIKLMGGLGEKLMGDERRAEALALPARFVSGKILNRHGALILNGGRCFFRLTLANQIFMRIKSYGWSSSGVVPGQSCRRGPEIREFR
jgi:hypothetical protein